MVFKVLYCISLNKSIVLHPAIVVDVVLFKEIGFSFDSDIMCLCFFVVISVSIYLDALFVGVYVLPFLLKIFENFHGPRFVVSHNKYSLFKSFIMNVKIHKQILFT